MVNRVKCTRCDNEILEATARKNNGLCAICKSDQHRLDLDAVVQSWTERPETLPVTHGIPLPDDMALRIAASQLKKRLFPDADDQMELVCHKFFDRAHTKWRICGARALSDKEKHALAVETFYGEVLNGGLIQYLSNESGAFAGWAVEAFEAIDIPAYADVMRNVQRLFPNGVIPEDADERCDRVEAIDEELLDTAEKPFWDRYQTDKTEIRHKLFQYLSK